MCGGVWIQHDTPTSGFWDRKLQGNWIFLITIKLSFNLNGTGSYLKINHQLVSYVTSLQKSLIAMELHFYLLITTQFEIGVLFFFDLL